MIQNRIISIFYENNSKKKKKIEKLLSYNWVTP